MLLLPPTIYRASDDEVVEHYARVDEVGLPIMAYNNPFDTKVDLTPQLLQRLDALENVVAIKEFSGDIRRVTEIQDLTGLDVSAGADDLLQRAPGRPPEPPARSSERPQRRRAVVALDEHGPQHVAGRRLGG